MFFPRGSQSPILLLLLRKGSYFPSSRRYSVWAQAEGIAVVLQAMSRLSIYCPIGIGGKGLMGRAFILSFLFWASNAESLRKASD